MLNSHLLLLPEPCWHEKKAKVLTICLWLGKKLCSTRGNFSAPNELKILMSWENLGWGRGKQKNRWWLSVAYCVTGKCLQNVLILVNEVRETCYYAFPTLPSWPNNSKKIWSCHIYIGTSQPLYTNLGLREWRRGSRARKGVSLSLVTDLLWTSFAFQMWTEWGGGLLGRGKSSEKWPGRTLVLPLLSGDKINQSPPLDLCLTAKSKQGTFTHCVEGKENC